MKPFWLIIGLFLSGCGVIYVSPAVTKQSTGFDVQVVSLTAESVLVANRSDYQPRQLPAVFFQNAGASGTLKATGAVPEPTFRPQKRPNAIQTRLPPDLPFDAYKIGVGDVLVLATQNSATTVENLTGLLAAQNRRQGYTVQDDGAIAIPDVGHVPLADLTLEEAEAELFQALVENQIDPSFSLEISEFNSKRVSIGGAVRNPTVAPITLTPLYLDEALTAAGGVKAPDREFVTLRIYRDGSLFQLPLNSLSGERIRLKGGDRVFVDTDYQLEQAQAYFEEQIKLSGVRQAARAQAVEELDIEISLRRAALDEARSSFQAQIELDAVDRDYVYLAGEVKTQSRFPLPFGRKASLADALFSTGGALTETGNPAEIYVLRGSQDTKDNGSVFAWHLNARNAVNIILATRMELRPNDVIFIAEQPITRWGRVLEQFVPSLITTYVE